jgi:hypothetical protein
MIRLGESRDEVLAIPTITRAKNARSAFRIVIALHETVSDT